MAAPLRDTLERPREVHSHYIGSGEWEYQLYCWDGHEVWASLPYREHDTALFSTCEACAVIHEGNRRARGLKFSGREEG